MMTERDIEADRERMVRELNVADQAFFLEIVKYPETGIEYVMARFRHNDPRFFGGLRITDDIKNYAAFFELMPNGEYDILLSTSAINPKLSHATEEDLSSNMPTSDEDIQGPKLTEKITAQIDRHELMTPITDWLEKNGYTRHYDTSIAQAKNTLAKSTDAGTIIGVTLLAFSVIIALVMLISTLPSTTTVNGVTTHKEGQPLPLWMALTFIPICVVFAITGIILLIRFLPKTIRTRKSLKK